MPHPLDDNPEELNSSVSSDVLDAGSTNMADANANSSDATGDNEADDLLSVVRDVVDESRADASAASPAEGSEGGQQPGDAPKNEPDDENYSDVPFHKHPRFQHLLRKSKTYEADAVRYRNVQGFLDQNGLAAEEAADALVIAGLLKTNPAEAWSRLKPVVQSLLQAAGEVLPQDLAQRVQNGEMSQEAALEVSRSRAQVQSVQARQTFEQQRAERTQSQQRAQALYETAATWEADRRAKDPNFDAKMPLLEDALAGMQRREGVPNTPEGVRDQLKRAYDAVNARYAPPQPQRQPRPAVRPVSGGAVAGNAQPKPKNMLDIVRANRASR
ncbi:MAG: hypothetical protein HYU59_05785 [Magnetospirillum gryphiswaldense]|nr:hypothetical protein [Magnetospirillum gryphiswaldense]